MAEYLMSISIGTPSFDILAVADTGSDLIWTQCKPCSQCFQQDDPLFDPTQSSTYKIFPCNASQCDNLDEKSYSSNNSCQYSASYGDGSFSNGDLAADTLTLPSTTGSPVIFPETVIGCGHNNNLTVHDRTSGIIGLGGDKGNIVIDSGTTLTLLPDDFYSELESAVSSEIHLPKLEASILCYEATNFAIPDITIHFTNADVKLQSMNVFFSVTNMISCFTFAPAGEFAIYGNMAQMNFLIGYDTDNQTVSFKPTDCSKKNGAAEVFTLGGLNLMKNVNFSLIVYHLI
ncbi:hypothetical protein PTKIN_Ptkin01aG0389200 [Pterospermum kingtungense]